MACTREPLHTEEACRKLYHWGGLIRLMWVMSLHLKVALEVAQQSERKLVQ